MRRVLVIFLLTATFASFAGAAGALRCACCVPSEAPAMSTAELCCPGGDADRCASRALNPSPSLLLLAFPAEAARIAVLPPVAPPLVVGDALPELRADAARPSGRDGLALRSILRI
jgi:hypothetical protein